MDFLKKHYEKILLGAVLIGLAIAVGYLPFKIGTEKQKVKELETSLVHPRIKALTNLDVSFADGTLKRMSAPAMLDFSTTNRRVNPMPWQQTKESRLIPASSTGPTAVIVTNITPLYLTISLDSISVSEDGAARYFIGVEKQAAARREKQKKTQTYGKIGDKNDTFQITEVKGPADNPTNIVLVLTDSGDTVGISKEKPFRRVDGYTASLYYDPQKKKWTDQRMGAALNINGEDYKIVAITQNEVVLSAPNQKKWPLKLSAPP